MTFLRSIAYDRYFSEHITMDEVFSIGSMLLQKIDDDNFIDIEDGKIYSSTLVNEWARQRIVCIYTNK